MNRTNMIAAIFALMAAPVFAVSPASVEQGRQLFEKNWSHGNPAISSDGLGPLFNATSCVACHNQGGVGGAGDSRFNAKTIGIESINISGAPIESDDLIKEMVSTFHPGFVGPDGSLLNTLSLAHHGGSPLFQKARASMMNQIDSRFSVEGGPLDAAEVRRAYATPILFNSNASNRAITIRARLFQRNTSPLFGLALIDKVDERLIQEQARIQKKHPEISGRPATLRSGHYGKFGWRGNVDSLLGFVEQACAAEVGLETRRRMQPIDPMNRDYRNTSIDIQDKQIIAIRDFIAALPVPTREIPSDSHEREMAIRGEQVFQSVGCAVCHVPNMGPAKGLYSDILLHDMGYESMDLNHAEPYITRVTSQGSRVLTTTTIMPYYGDSTPISSTTGSSTRESDASKAHKKFTNSNYGFTFVAPTGPSEKTSTITFNTERIVDPEPTTQDRGMFPRSNRRTIETKTREDFFRVQLEHTNFNQEWRTPPLWGVRDSAPYMHDGRAETLLEAIVMHDGESAGTRDRFLNLPMADRQALIAFLNTLVAPKNAPQFDAD